MEPTKLTQGTIGKLKPGEKVRDTQVKGLFADRGATGVSLKIQADLWSGRTGARTLVRTVRITLGRYPELSIDAARAEAMRLLAMIKQGIDPKAPERATPGQLSVGVSVRWTAGARFAHRAPARAEPPSAQPCASAVA